LSFAQGAFCSTACATDTTILELAAGVHDTNQDSNPRAAIGWAVGALLRTQQLDRGDTVRVLDAANARLRALGRPESLNAEECLSIHKEHDG